MKRHILISVVFSLLLSVNMLFGGSSAKDAARLFQEKQYEEAVQLWKSEASHHASSSLFYNIGLAESRLGHTAESIYAYEQALRLKPMRNSIKEAVLAERKKIDNAVVPIESFFLRDVFVGYVTFLRPGWWVMIGLLLLLFSVLLWLQQIKILSIIKFRKPPAIKWSLILAFLFLVTSFFSFQTIYRTHEYIVMTKCSLHQASSPESPEIRVMGAGEKVIVEDEIGEWYYVALLNLDYGWIKKECCKEIML